ncbi:TLD-domain-containing protein [Blastocladiella britannica]|nr:TLD-domain-containing protein [Blastocladiella britannica]
MASSDDIDGWFGSDDATPSVPMARPASGSADAQPSQPPQPTTTRSRTLSLTSALGSIAGTLSSYVRHAAASLPSSATPYASGSMPSVFRDSIPEVTGDLGADGPPLSRNMPLETDPPSAVDAGSVLTDRSLTMDADLVDDFEHIDEEDHAATARQAAIQESLAAMANVLELNGRLPMTKPVLTLDLALQLRGHLPILPRIADRWQLVYSMDQHGISLATLYDKFRTAVSNKTVQQRGFVLVILDSTGRKFGAFLSDPLHNSQSFFGTGETFVFSCDKESDKATVYPWTGENEYFLFGDLKYFAVGAGDGHFALWLDHDLEQGKSDPVPTFGNPVLASASTFVCYELEVWGVAP